MEKRRILLLLKVGWTLKSDESIQTRIEINTIISKNSNLLKIALS